MIPWWSILPTLIAGIYIGLRIAWYFEKVPLGYEDETGFHYGPEPTAVIPPYDQEREG
jgi:hypothetical protein